MYETLKKDNPGFVQCACKGPLAKFRSRGVYAIDSSTIQLAYWCIGWAKHRQKKAAVKLHMVANVRSRLPHFCLIDRAKDHDSKKADELLASLKEGDIAILDRAYNAFAKLYRHHQRGGFFVVREKNRMKSRVVMSVVRGCGIATRQNTARNETNRHTHQRNGNDNRPKIKTVTELTTVTAQKILSMGW